jgi:hypothetical protein
MGFAAEEKRKRTLTAADCHVQQCFILGLKTAPFDGSVCCALPVPSLPLGGGEECSRINRLLKYRVG